MNKVILVGRLARDPELKYTPQDSNAVCRFTLAVERDSSKEKSADFIGCVCFGKTAENLKKYKHKGETVAIDGSVRTGSYTNRDGEKVYTTDIVCNKVEFVGSKKENASDEQERFDGFRAEEEEIPF